MDRGPWQATVHGVTKSWTWLSTSASEEYKNNSSEKTHAPLCSLWLVYTSQDMETTGVLSVEEWIKISNGMLLSHEKERSPAICDNVDEPWRYYVKSTESSGSVQFSSVAQSRSDSATPWTSTPGPPVHHQLPEVTQTHVHWVGDAIQPSHPLSFPSPPTFNLSQHQGLFKWVSSSHEVAKVLEFQIQHQSFNEHPGLISFRMDWLDLLAVQGTLKSLYNTTVRKHQFFSTQLSSPSNSHIHTWPLEKP